MQSALPAASVRRAKVKGKQEGEIWKKKIKGGGVSVIFHLAFAAGNSSNLVTEKEK